MKNKPPAAPAAPLEPEGPTPQLPPFRPLSGRHHLLIAALTLATVVLIAAQMLRPSRDLAVAKATRAEAARLLACPPGAASAAAGCPGSTMPVMVLPAPARPVR